MQTVNIHEAKTHLSKLLESVMYGEEIIIAKAGKPIARLGPFINLIHPKRFGLLKNKIKIAKDFDAPLPANILDDFEN